MGSEDWEGHSECVREWKDKKYNTGLKIIEKLKVNTNIININEYNFGCFKIESKGMIFNYFPIKNRIYFFTRKNWINDANAFLTNYYKLNNKKK